MTAAPSTIAIEENISQCHNQVKTRSSALSRCFLTSYIIIKIVDNGLWSDSSSFLLIIRYFNGTCIYYFR